VAISRAIQPIDPFDEMDDEEIGETVVPVDGLDDEEELDEDGGLTIDLGRGLADRPDVASLPFDANLAEALSEHTMLVLASNLLTKIDEDIQSRDEWSRRYRDGLDLLGINPEPKNEPWPNCSNVVHPVLAETAVAFQANAVMELCPPSGPAMFKAIGQETALKMQVGRRVAAELNFQLMERMTEWRMETERLLFRLPLSGTVLKKVTFDPIRKRPSSKMVTADDFIIQYGASDLETCPRYTHREHIFKSTLETLISVGFYRDVDLQPSQIFDTDTDDAEDDIIGVSAPIDDDRFEIYEVHADLKIDGVDEEIDRHLPYIITIETGSQKVLAIRRNWREDDPLYIKRIHFVDYSYLPGLGWYAFGVMHLVGGGADAATALLRQLIDAGTLSNVPSGFKTTGFRVKGDETPVMPGEFRDVDVPSGKLVDALLPLPYRAPSEVSFALLQNIVEEARRVASVADMKIADASANTPVGTTLALLERSLRVMSAVHARLHQSMKKELGLIKALIRDYMPPSYEYDQELQYNRSEDFGGSVDIIPVSDPNSSTQAQRVIVYQAAVNIAAQTPQVYDLPRLHRGMLEVLNIANADKIVPLPDDLEPTDPVSEGMAILTGKPVRAFIEQDHEAHLRVHMAALQDPKLQAMVGQSPMAQAIMGAAHAHIQEHMAFAYRREIERKMGVALPPPGDPLPSDTETLIANLAAAASEQLLQDHIAEAQAALQAQQQADPATQLEANAQRIQEEAHKDKREIAEKTLAFKDKELAAKMKMHDEELASQESRLGFQIKERLHTASNVQAPARAEKKEPSVSISYKDTPPDVQRDIEARAGLTPSKLGKNENSPAELQKNAPKPTPPRKLPAGMKRPKAKPNA